MLQVSFLSFCFVRKSDTEHSWVWSGLSVYELWLGVLPENAFTTHGLSCSHVLISSVRFLFTSAVLHSGDYYLFESDSEEEEELFSEEKKPQKQTAFQVSSPYS